MHTVPSTFSSQTIQTETQADRIEREEEEAAYRKSVEDAKKQRTREPQSWLTRQLSALSSDSASGLVLVNLVGVVGLSSFLGYKAWGLYDKGRLGWNHVGIGAGIFAAVGIVEGVFGRFLYDAKKRN